MHVHVVINLRTTHQSLYNHVEWCTLPKTSFLCGNDPGWVSMQQEELFSCVNQYFSICDVEHDNDCISWYFGLIDDVSTCNLVPFFFLFSSD